MGGRVKDRDDKSIMKLNYGWWLACLYIMFGDYLVPRGEVSTHSRICSSNSVLEMVAARNDCSNDQYLGAFGPSPAASFAFIVVVDSRDMSRRLARGNKGGVLISSRQLRALIA